jgi:SnoaL-like domain
VPRVDAELADRLAIRDVVETWANARDSRDWEAFRACWHEDGYMMATWFQGPKEDFIRVSQEGAARGVNILHFTGGVRITLAGTRAIAQTRMTIMQRGPVDGVLCDVACTGRFYDFFEKRGVGPAATGGKASRVVPPEPALRGVSGVVPPEPALRGVRGVVPPEPAEQRDGHWAIVLRQPIYEKDRLDPVDPGATLTLDPDVLARFPEGYRYLAYLQSQAGYPVKPDMPGLTGPEVERLYERGAAWLAGQPVAP